MKFMKYSLCAPINAESAYLLLLKEYVMYEQSLVNVINSFIHIIKASIYMGMFQFIKIKSQK